jgi:hypothetical protein
MTQPIATVVAAFVLALALAFLLRWEVQNASTGGFALRLDRWTGAINLCESEGAGRRMKCDQ